MAEFFIYKYIYYINIFIAKKFNQPKILQL